MFAARRFVGTGSRAWPWPVTTRRNAPEVLAAVNASLTGVLDDFRPHTTELARFGPAGRPSCRSLAAGRPRAGAQRARAGPCPLAPQLERAAPRARVPAPRGRERARGRLHRRPAGCLTRAAPQDIFVLARKREPLRQLSEALTAAGIPMPPRGQPAARRPGGSGPAGPAGRAGLARARPLARPGPGQPAVWSG